MSDHRQRVLYVVATSRAGPVKVGIAVDPKRRVRTLECAIGARLRMVWVSPPCAAARDVEALAHRRMAEHRTVGEWFNLPFDEAVGIAKSLTGRKLSRRARVSVEAGVAPAGDSPSAMDAAAEAALPLLLDFLEKERART